MDKKYQLIVLVNRNFEINRERHRFHDGKNRIIFFRVKKQTEYRLYVYYEILQDYIKSCDGEMREEIKEKAKQILVNLGIPEEILDVDDYDMLWEVKESAKKLDIETVELYFKGETKEWKCYGK